MVHTRYEELKKILLTAREEHTAILRGMLRSVREEHEARAGDPSEEAYTDSRDTHFQLIDKRQTTLKEIAAAIARLEAGSYGFCNDCGKEISELRLRALPFASHCAGCAERTEKVQAVAVRRMAAVVLQGVAHM